METEFKDVYGTYWAEDLPKGKYHIVLEVEYYDVYYKKKVIGNVWKGCILGPDNKCIESSLDGCPNIRSPFHDEGGFTKIYRMTVASFNTLEDSKVVKEFIDSETFSNKLVDGAKYWVNKFGTDYTKNESFSNENAVQPKEAPKKVNQTTDQQVVQSLISKNATKIRDLEQQLRELRLIQKGLKKQR